MSWQIFLIIPTPKTYSMSKITIFNNCAFHFGGEGGSLRHKYATADIVFYIILITRSVVKCRCYIYYGQKFQVQLYARQSCTSYYNITHVTSYIKCRSNGRWCEGDILSAVTLLRYIQQLRQTMDGIGNNKSYF